MTTKMTILYLLFALPAGMAMAEDACFVPMADWQPRAAVAELAAQNGWTVHRIKIDDGCYEIYALDTSGRRIEVVVHPQTLQVIRLEYEQHEEDDRRDDDGQIIEHD